MFCLISVYPSISAPAFQSRPKTYLNPVTAVWFINTPAGSDWGEKNGPRMFTWTNDIFAARSSSYSHCRPSRTTSTCCYSRLDRCADTVYVLNAPAITQPHAIQHLAFDLRGCEVDIAVNGVITETYRKKKHADHCFAIDGYCLFRRDRLGSRGGGVAVYVNNVMSAEIGTYPGDSPDYELLWISDRYP